MLLHKPSTLKYASCNASEQNLASLVAISSWSALPQGVKSITIQEEMVNALYGTVGVVTDGVHINCICVNLGGLISRVGNSNLIYKRKSEGIEDL